MQKRISVRHPYPDDSTSVYADFIAHETETGEIQIKYQNKFLYVEIETDDESSLNKLLNDSTFRDSEPEYTYKVLNFELALRYKISKWLGTFALFSIGAIVAFNIFSWLFLGGTLTSTRALVVTLLIVGVFAAITET